MTTFLLHLGFDIELAELTDLLERIGATESDCVAFRLCWPDGAFWDGCVGGTKDEMRAALAALKVEKPLNMH
ncbi:hypothetical protein RT97_13945 [Variovorax paradoxus]|uniref:Uncharacterized protein n=1 Tax=Variovorax paradoxus TaxID=34073 RepID=A0A0D0MII4_VARPD|nr:hypothetical protein [Variovorax paradoxus]KIQ32136.1 hypothetical protein RT97_13945 [Variovorax paradoxus]